MQEHWQPYEKDKSAYDPIFQFLNFCLMTSHMSLLISGSGEPVCQRNLDFKFPKKPHFLEYTKLLGWSYYSNVFFQSTKSTIPQKRDNKK